MAKLSGLANLAIGAVMALGTSSASFPAVPSKSKLIGPVRPELRGEVVPCELKCKTFFDNNTGDRFIFVESPESDFGIYVKDIKINGY